MNKENKLRELVALQRLAALPEDQTTHCPRLLHHFFHRGIEEDGDHLCFALKLDQASLEDVWDRSKGFPVPVVKRILSHILRGLSTLHGCGIAHTGTTLIMVSTIWGSDYRFQTWRRAT
jgi:serine/threonine-protein kinase SRPK3